MLPVQFGVAELLSCPESALTGSTQPLRSVALVERKFVIGSILPFLWDLSSGGVKSCFFLQCQIYLA